MKNYELIGLICAASVKNNIAMTTAEIIKIAEYLSEHRVGITPPFIYALDEFRKSSAKVEVEDEPAINNPVEELGISKKNREKLRHADMSDVLKKPAVQTDINKRMDDAYLGEHPNIQPAPVEKKPLSPREQQLWDYMQSHPDSRMPKTCEDLNLSQANCFWLKQQLKKKGWIISAVENVKEFN